MMKNKVNFVSPRQFAHHMPGEIVTARVLNPLENHHCGTGKARPAVLIRREGARWQIMGLTTRPNFANGKPRQPVQNTSVCGLGTRDSYVWGHPTWISALDVGDHIGYADDGLMATILCAGTKTKLHH